MGRLGALVRSAKPIFLHNMVAWSCSRWTAVLCACSYVLRSNNLHKGKHAHLASYACRFCLVRLLAHGCRSMAQIAVCSHSVLCGSVSQFGYTAACMGHRGRVLRPSKSGQQLSLGRDSALW